MSSFDLMSSFNLATIERDLNKFLFRWNGGARRRLWLKLAKLIGNGVPILTALESIRNRRTASSGKSHPHAVATDHWIARIKNGARLSAALGDWVSEDERMLIAAGEQSGSVERALISAARVMEAKTRIKNAVISGLAYPFILLCLSFGMIYMFSFKVVPAFSQIVQGDRWVGMAHYVVNFSQFVQNWLWLVVIILAVVIAVFFISLPRWNNKLRIKADRYVPYSVYRIVLGSTWLISFSALVEAGLRVENALRELAATASPWMQVRIQGCLRGMQAGLSIGDALIKSGYEFPDREIIDDLSVYSSLSGFDVALQVLGKEWLEESVEQIRTRMQVVFGVSILLLGVIIGFMASGLISMELQVTTIVQGH